MYKKCILLGVFDVISLKSISAIYEAKKMAEELTIGVIADALCESITGERPITSENEREKTVLSIKNVNKTKIVNSLDELEAFKDSKKQIFLCEDSLFLDNSIKEKTILLDEIADFGNIIKEPKENAIIGYTTGVFDLCHNGHINIIKQAKAHCDYLIVGVSTDELVKSYKNRTPVFSYNERTKIIENIDGVDRVVKQETLSKFDAWTSLKYHVLFHGNDWKGSSLYSEEEEKLKKVGVKTEYFQYTKGISTTEIIERMKKNK